MPAVIALLGDRAWGLPKWLDKLVIDFDIEGGAVRNRGIPDDSAQTDSRDAMVVDADSTLTVDGTDYDMLTPYAQAAMARKDYSAAATLTGNILANIPNVDDQRRKAGRELLTQAYTRLGAAGGAAPGSVAASCIAS